VNHYELMVIFSPALTDEEQKQQSAQVEELISKEKGTLHLVDHWGKRKLAYAIKRQRQGFYDWFYFEMEPGRLAEVERKLKMSEVILRFMALKMEKIQIGNLHREVERRAQAQQPAIAAVPPEMQTVAPEQTEPAPAPAAVEAPAAEQTPVAETATEPTQE
jgi:small subunit ribosomal protein S6